MRKLIAVMLFAVLTFACRDSGEKVSDGVAGEPGTETSTDATAGSDTSATTATTSVASADTDFTTKAAQGGLAEVAMAQMAHWKTSNADVKAFAERMNTDHTNANNELTAWASSKGVTLPAETDADHKGGIDHLNALSGKEFDKSYMDHMVDDHRKTVALFEGASQTAQDADLKAWATKTLPTLREHLKLAENTRGKL